MAIKLGVGSNLTSPQSGVPHAVVNFEGPFNFTGNVRWRGPTFPFQRAFTTGSCILLPFWHEVIYSSCPGCPPPRLQVTGRLAGSLGGRRRAQQRTRRQLPSQRRRLAHRYPRAGSARTIKLGGVSAASALSLPVNRNRPARSPSRRPADSGPEHPLHSATRELEAAGVEFRSASRVGPPWPLGP